MTMGKLDTDHRPAYAITCWADDNYIYVELPMTSGGTPFIQKYALSEGGLRSALSILRARRDEVLAPTHDRPANYTLPAQPMIQRSLTKAQTRLYAETTEAQRANAARVLAKLGFKP